MRPATGIATDAAHSMKNGSTRYRGVDIATGEELFREDLGNMTVNAGEFLGVVAAVRYIIENAYTPAVIYTDSVTAITWFKNKQTASKKRISALFKAEVFLRVMAAAVDRIEVRHWDNERWGETPADFGNK
jgi:ribonuclease HI